MIDRKKIGKANRSAGKRFELKVRSDLEEKGWIVFRNGNDVTPVEQIDIGEYARFFRQARPKWNPATRSPMMMQSGYPDFICIFNRGSYFDVQFVECKVNGILSREEKDKNEWIKAELNIPVYIASRGKKRGTIEYILV